ncbi:hypothetical protein K438DRAFT_600595 [Mycena galopus ATCC 62051]|nr:hypothetical protein K438DRAFT_600595 [Mycena galopus ATCC 62051]
MYTIQLGAFARPRSPSPSPRDRFLLGLALTHVPSVAWVVALALGSCLVHSSLNLTAPNSKCLMSLESGNVSLSHLHYLGSSNRDQFPGVAHSRRHCIRHSLRTTRAPPLAPHHARTHVHPSIHTSSKRSDLDAGSTSRSYKYHSPRLTLPRARHPQAVCFSLGWAFSYYPYYLFLPCRPRAMPRSISYFSSTSTHSVHRNLTRISHVTPTRW